ncbi:hypothetical protein Tel_15605 [Candidatus Tenderia electrophaga]|jgi:hypothetical protein|uniref:Serine aminopeptidase S33 domain-containing protein n=1 Tax=Candidatus Tenderia electrophaga TaxID=1748243 RepID=A0A0S2TH25_9GAMM|nr:hypothetical protein Tel_15605 [Candidatus Tenderia electrophaga]
MSAHAANPLFIDGPAGALEALAENFDHLDNGVLVVCHPHPQHGGTMNNKVVHTLSRAGHELGLATLRFNYRGVGKSGGSYAEGEGETDDLLAVIDWLDETAQPPTVWLAGFSFGAYVAMRASSQRPVDQLITVAPAVHLLRFQGLAPPACPWLLLQGTADEIVPFEEVRAWIDKLETPPQTVYFEAAGHFFHGRLVELRRAVTERLARQARPR